LETNSADRRKKVPKKSVVAKSVFVEWAKREVEGKKLVILSDNHNGAGQRYEVYKDVLKSCKPGVLFMEVPYINKANTEALKDYWNNEAKQTGMSEIVNVAANYDWKILNADADMRGGKTTLPGGVTAKKMSGARQRFMAQNLRSGLKLYPNKGAIFIVGTGHVKGGKMLDEKIPTFNSLMSFNSDKDLQMMEVTYGGDERVLAYSVDPGQML
jgi:hypothetical protein